MPELGDVPKKALRSSVRYDCVGPNSSFFVSVMGQVGVVTLTFGSGDFPVLRPTEMSHGIASSYARRGQSSPALAPFHSYPARKSIRQNHIVDDMYDTV